MVRKKRRFSGFIALAAFVLFAPLVAMAYELPSFEYDSSLDLSYAGRMAQDADGNVYVADSRRGRVYVFDKYGRSMDAVNSIAQPAAVAAGPAGEIYVASPHGVYLLGDNGQASSVVGQEAIDSPVDMAIDAVGQVYLLDGGTRSVKVFTSAGVSLGEFAGGVAKYPVSVAVGLDSVSGQELIYVGYSVETTDADNTEIVMVYDLSYNLVRSFGAAEKLAFSYYDADWKPTGVPSGKVARAAGIVVDRLGRVYVADPYGKRVDVYSEQGDFLGDYYVEGNSPPASLLFDMYGRLFVSITSGRVDLFSVDGQNVANAIPTTPFLVSPVGGARVGSLSPGLVAGNSIDPNGDNLVYEFEVAIDASMSGVVWSSAPVAEGGEGSTSAAVTISLDEDSEYYWRVRSFDGKEYSRYSYVTRFFVNTVNSAPVIDSSSPSSVDVLEVAVGETVQFVLGAVDQDRDQLALTWFLNDVEVSSGAGYSYVGISDDIGANVVVSRASDGEFSVERRWDVAVMRPNTSPTKPAINYPSAFIDVAVLRPELSVSNSFDAEGDVLTYLFEVSRTDNFSDIVATVGDVPSGAGFTSATIAVDLVENNLYYWRAKACEVSIAGSYVADYYCSSPSATGVFVVNTVNDPVGAPSVASPADAIHVNTIERQLSLSANNASDPDMNDVLVYDFELASDQNYANVILRNEVVAEGGSGSTSVEVVGALEENSTYYWRVRVSDGETVSAWVNASFFVDNYNDAPTQPAIESPAASSETTTLNQVLSVLNSSDLNGDTLSYVFEIDSSDNFSNPARQLSSLVAEADLTTSWLVPVALADNTRHYWRVKASDGVSESEWSIVNEFFVNTYNDAPGAPVVKAPSSSVAVNVDRPELTVYGASDVDGDELGYVYQISRSSDFSALESESGEEGLSWTVDLQLAENAIYYWRARAIDEHGLSGAWSDAASFMVNVVNENPGVPVAGTYSYAAGSDVVLLIGGAVDPDADTLSYSVELYSDRSMSSLAYSEDNVTGEDEVLCNVGVLASGVYYWRVRAYDGKLYGSWSDTRVISVNAAGETSNGRTDKARGHKRF